MKTIFVIFGATGDLAKRKLFPALFGIFQDKRYGDIDILALGRKNFTGVSYREYIDNETKDLISRNDSFQDFLNTIDYLKLELDNGLDYTALKKHLLANKEKDIQIIFYLAISPEFFPNFIDNYKNNDLGNIRIIFEKPFGTDLDSAKKLNSKIMEVFDEEEIYRIDHYVGKESIQNILAFRFTNTIFEAIWNNKYIDNIQITASESLGVADRGGYYDKFGALRDMLQNHLLQVLSLIVMDSPSKIDASGITGEKLKVFRNIELGDKFENNVIFGQYNGYQNEKGVANLSKTETFVALKLNVSTWNFEGVPIYLRTGKYLESKTTRIVIEFKEVPHILFNALGNIEKNRIILEVIPNEGIDIHFNIKQDGNSKNTERVKSVFKRTGESKEAYMKLLEDVIIGDKTLFTSWALLEESWRIVDDLVNCKSNCPIVHKYEKGSKGPDASAILLENDNRKWYD